MSTPTQPVDSGTITNGKIADTMIGSCIRVLKRSRNAASRSERGWPGRWSVSETTSTVSIVPDRPCQAVDQRVTRPHVMARMHVRNVNARRSANPKSTVGGQREWARVRFVLVAECFELADVFALALMR